MILFVAAAVCPSGRVPAVEAQEKSAAQNESSSADETSDAPVPAEEEGAARRRAYSMGIVMLGAILICGVSLVALVLLWGHRVRRIARQPLPKVAQRDDLWYLKAKDKPDIGDTSVGEESRP